MRRLPKQLPARIFRSERSTTVTNESPEGAKYCSPGRKPWVFCLRASPVGTKEAFAAKIDFYRCGSSRRESNVGMIAICLKTYPDTRIVRWIRFQLREYLRGSAL